MQSMEAGMSRDTHVSTESPDMDAETGALKLLSTLKAQQKN
jgi:hypothetical protein